MVVEICICDDEPNELERYSELILSICRAHNLTIRLQTFLSGMTLYDAMEQGRYNPDIIFMDILMDGINGVETGVMLRGLCWSSILIFLTTTPSYALPSFDAEPFDYTIKDEQTSERLSATLLRAVAELSTRPTGCYLCVTKQGTTRIPLRDVRYFEAAGHNINIYHSKENLPACHYARFNELRAQLGSANGSFIRIHRSFYVNLSKVYRLYSHTLETFEGDVLPIGRKYLSELKTSLLAMHTVTTDHALSALEGSEV